MIVRPLGDRVLVERIEEAAKTSGGLFIPDNAKEKPMEARVIAVGSGKRLEDGSRQAPSVKVGDKILLAKYAGAEIKLDGKAQLILSEDEVLAVLEG